MRRWALPALLIIGICIAGVFILIRQPDKKPVANSAIHLQLRAFALNLDPATMADTESRKVATLLYSGLVATNEDGSAEPRAAKSWKKVDTRTWEFELKDGLTFPDGTKVTAAKVIASLCASMQPANVQSWSLASIEQEAQGPNKPITCSGLVAEDANKLLIRESSPTPWLLEALAGPGGWIVDTDPAKRKAYGIRPGLGPYVVKQVIADQSIALERRQAGTAVVGKADQVTFDYVPDPSLATRVFETGKLDLLEIDSPQIAELALQPNGTPRRTDAQLERFDVDRVRVVYFNLKRLSSEGFSEAQQRVLLQQYSQAISRAEIAGAFARLGEANDDRVSPLQRRDFDNAHASTNSRVHLATKDADLNYGK